MHLAAVGFEIVDEAREEFVELVHGRPFREAGGVAGLLPVTEAGLLEIAVGVVAAEGLANEGTVACVADMLGRVVEKFLLGEPRQGCFVNDHTFMIASGAGLWGVAFPGKVGYI